MTRSLKTASIVLIVIVVSLIGLSVGVTAAYWGGEGGGGGGGETSAVPQMKSVDWNAWAKYFTYDVSANVVYITGYTNTTMSTLTFPKKVTLKRTGTEGNYSYAYTTEEPNGIDIITYDSKNNINFAIRNTFVKDATLKEQIVKIFFPDCVSTIDAATFSNMSQLQEIYFEDNVSPILGDYCFMNCVMLKDVYGRSTESKATVFAGCSNITFHA